MQTTQSSAALSMRNDYIHELIRLEEDSDYNQAQEKLFHEHFEIADLTNIALRLRGIVDTTVREVAKKEVDVNSKKIRGFTKLDQYPIGFCNDITHSVEAILKGGRSDAISPYSSVFSNTMVAQMMGVEAIGKIIDGQESLPYRISKFEEAGGVFGSVWGIMPSEECFQWFILAGNHVINVANDASNRDAFPIEITPLQPQTYRSLRDYSDYVKIAEKYWGWSVFRNTLFPTLAALYPIIAIDERCMLHFPHPEVLTKKSMAGGFKLSQAIWESESLNNPPKELESAFGNLGLLEPRNMADTFEKWNTLRTKGLDENTNESENFELQRARYLVGKAEYEWLENFDRSQGKPALGIQET